jgi:hypothetical protein
MLLISCAHLRGPPPTCVTRCGLRLLGALPSPESYSFPRDEPWTCESLQRAEDEMLAVFAGPTINANGRTKAIKENACAGLRFNLRVWGQPTLTDALGRKVTGTTSCDFKTSTIGNLSWQRSALLHETLHQLQDCAAEGTEEHPLWAEDGLVAAESMWLSKGRGVTP